MGLRSFIRGFVNRGDTNPIDPRRGQSFWIAPPWIPDGLLLTQHQIFEVSAVWACCNVIANSIASAPWFVLEEMTNGRRVKVRGSQLAWILNTQPNPESSAQAIKESWIWQALIYGDAYAEIVRDGAGRVVEVWPLLSERMLLPTRNEAKQLVFQYRNPDGGVAELDNSRVFHLRGPSIDGLMGLGTVTAALKSIATAAAQDRFASAFFANGATPSGIVTTPKALQPKDREALKIELQMRYSGARNNGKPLVLEGGADFKPVSADPEKSQLTQARQFSIEEIARYFGVPLHFLASPAGSQGYGRNLTDLGKALIDYGLMPWKRRLEQEAQAKLVGQRSNLITVIDLSSLQKGTDKENAETDEIRIRSGVLTINEVREEEGLNHGPAFLDNHFIQTTLQPVERALAPPPPPATPGDHSSPNIPQPGGGEDQGDGVEDPGEAADAQLRRVFVSIMGRELDRYARKMANRKADVQRLAPDRVAAALDKARAAFRDALVEDCLAVAESFKPSLPVTVDQVLIWRAADAVEQGEPPQLATVRLLAPPNEVAHA